MAPPPPPPPRSVLVNRRPSTGIYSHLHQPSLMVVNRSNHHCESAVMQRHIPADMQIVSRHITHNGQAGCRVHSTAIEPSYNQLRLCRGAEASEPHEIAWKEGEQVKHRLVS